MAESVDGDAHSTGNVADNVADNVRGSKVKAGKTVLLAFQKKRRRRTRKLLMLALMWTLSPLSPLKNLSLR